MLFLFLFIFIFIIIKSLVASTPNPTLGLEASTHNPKLGVNASLPNLKVSWTWGTQLAQNQVWRGVVHALPQVGLNAYTPNQG